MADFARCPQGRNRGDGEGSEAIDVAPQLAWDERSTARMNTGPSVLRRVIGGRNRYRGFASAIGESAQNAKGDKKNARALKFTLFDIDENFLRFPAKKRRGSAAHNSERIFDVNGHLPFVGRRRIVPHVSRTIRRKAKAKGSRVNRAMMHDQQRRQTAHHEAAHAVAHFFFGLERLIEYIDMMPDPARNSLGRVKTSIGDWASKSMGHSERFIQMRQDCFVSLAGKAAEAKLIEANFIGVKVVGGQHWLDNLFASESPAVKLLTTANLHEWLETTIVDSVEGKRRASDLEWVVISARSWGEGRNFIERLAKLVDEFVREPRLWHVIESLAAKLCEVEGILMGDEARSIMRNAWGDNAIPVKVLPKWKRRFPLKMPKIRMIVDPASS